jgi:uncharacterized protein YjbI with pentapeptide repeats
MLNQLENHQENEREFDDSETEKQHFKRSERYIPSKNWLSKFCKWADFGNKTLWEILQLIGLPTVVTVLGLWINYSVSSTQKEIEAQKYQQTALENYINAMTEIIVKHDIFRVGFKAEGEASQSETTAAKISQTNTENFDRNILTEELKSIAKAKTLTTLLLLKLDPERRDLLLYFLREADLCCTKSNTGSEPSEVTQKTQKLEVHLLQGIELQGANLSGADLKQADLQGTKLVGSDLRGANLAGSDLRGVTLNNANLWEAQLNKADLSKLETSPPRLTYAVYADFERANLEGANFQGAILNQANLKEANPGRANLADSKKNTTNLSYTWLRGASLHRAKLQGANLQNAHLEKSILPPEEQKKLSDEEKRLFRKRTDLREANLQGADLTNANLTGADLTGADLRGATLKGTTLKDANLSGANLQDIREGGKASDLLEAHLCNTTMWDGDVCNRDCWWSKLLFWRKSPHSSG